MLCYLVLELFDLLVDFCFYLIGFVLEGMVGEYLNIDILFFVDSVKEVEIFLFNCGIDFKYVELCNECVEVVFVMEIDSVDVNLIILLL